MLYHPSAFVTWCLPPVRTAPYLSCLSPRTLGSCVPYTPHFHHKTRTFVNRVKFLSLHIILNLVPQEQQIFKMNGLRSRFSSSKLGRRLRAVRSAVFPSEVQRGKRRSKSSSLSGNGQNHFLDSAIDDNEIVAQPWIIFPTTRASEEEHWQTQFWRSSVSDPGTPYLRANFEQTTAKKQTKAKFLFDRIRPRATTGNERQAAPPGVGGLMPPIVRDFGAVRQGTGTNCSCGGKCAAGSSGSSRRSGSSNLSPRRSGSTRNRQLEIFGQHRLPRGAAQFRSRLMKLSQSTPRRRSE